MSLYREGTTFRKAGHGMEGGQSELGHARRSGQRRRSTLALAAVGGERYQAMIHAARAGDELAFQGLIDAYWSTASRLARSILQTEEAAADAVQEALIKVHRAMPRYKDGNFRAWLLRIVSNTCYDHLRRLKRRPSVSLEQLIDESDFEAPEYRSDRCPERFALRRERIRTLSRLIERLPAWYREVVVLVDVHGYDYHEAAAHLGLPRGTIKSRLSRGRALLRDQLEAGDLLA